MFICKICNREFTRPKGLAQHIRHSHDLTAKDYYLNYIDSSAGFCCRNGCNNPTKFLSIQEGFQRHCCSNCSNKDEETIRKTNETKKSFSEEKRKSIRERTNNTCDERYGGIGFASKELREKGRQTNERVNGSRTYNNREKCEQTWIERTGYKSNFAVPENREMFKQIKKDKYGDENYNNKEKRAKTNNDRYGNVCPANSESGRRKAIQTMIENSGSVEQSYKDREKKSRQTKQERYGDENYHNVEQFKETIKTVDMGSVLEKRRGTCIDRYDEDSYSKTDEFKMKYENTCEERYGYKYPFAQDKFKQNYSKGEKEVVEFVKSIYEGNIIENTRRVLLPNEENGWKAGHELDIYIPDLCLAIEYNGNYYHDYNVFPEKRTEDEKKFNECVKLGIDLITVWENDWKSKNDEIKGFLTEEINKRKDNER